MPETGDQRDVKEIFKNVYGAYNTNEWVTADLGEHDDTLNINDEVYNDPLSWGVDIDKAEFFIGRDGFMDLPNVPGFAAGLTLSRSQRRRNTETGHRADNEHLLGVGKIGMFNMCIPKSYRSAFVDRISSVNSIKRSGVQFLEGSDFLIKAWDGPSIPVTDFAMCCSMANLPYINVSVIGKKINLNGHFLDVLTELENLATHNPVIHNQEHQPHGGIVYDVGSMYLGRLGQVPLVTETAVEDRARWGKTMPLFTNLQLDPVLRAHGATDDPLFGTISSEQFHPFRTYNSCEIDPDQSWMEYFECDEVRKVIIYPTFAHYYKQVAGASGFAQMPRTVFTARDKLQHFLEGSDLLRAAIVYHEVLTDAERQAHRENDPGHAKQMKRLYEHVSALRVETTYYGIHIRDCIAAHHGLLRMFVRTNALRVKHVPVGRALASFYLNVAFARSTSAFMRENNAPFNHQFDKLSCAGVFRMVQNALGYIMPGLDRMMLRATYDPKYNVLAVPLPAIFLHQQICKERGESHKADLYVPTYFVSLAPVLALLAAEPTRAYLEAAQAWTSNLIDKCNELNLNGTHPRLGALNAIALCLERANILFDKNLAGALPNTTALDGASPEAYINDMVVQGNHQQHLAQERVRHGLVAVARQRLGISTDLGDGESDDLQFLAELHLQLITNPDRRALVLGGLEGPVPEQPTAVAVAEARKRLGKMGTDSVLCNTDPKLVAMLFVDICRNMDTRRCVYTFINRSGRQGTAFLYAPRQADGPDPNSPPIWDDSSEYNPPDDEINKRGEQGLYWKIAHKHGFTWRALTRTSNAAKTINSPYITFLRDMMDHHQFAHRPALRTAVDILCAPHHAQYRALKLGVLQAHLTRLEAQETLDRHADLADQQLN